METLFRRHLALYADCHRDRLNCALHCAGIPMLFVAVLTPLALSRVPMPPGTIDISIGSLISDARAWWTAAFMFVVGWAFQIVGHAVFERRKPALLDNAFHMFIGPMFIMAKILVALGFRHDLAGLLRAPVQPMSRLVSCSGPKDSDG